MKPVERALAICQGGPLDGLRFSVPVTASEPTEEYPDLKWTIPELVVNDLVYKADQFIDVEKDHQYSIDIQKLINIGKATESEKHPVFQGFDLHVPASDNEVMGHLFIGVYSFVPNTAIPSTASQLESEV